MFTCVTSVAIQVGRTQHLDVILLYCAVDTTAYHCWCAVFMLPPFCSVAVGRRSLTVSMSAVVYSRRRFFSAEGELLHTHTQQKSERV